MFSLPAPVTPCLNLEALSLELSLLSLCTVSGAVLRIQGGERVPSEGNGAAPKPFLPDPAAGCHLVVEIHHWMPPSFLSASRRSAASRGHPSPSSGEYLKPPVISSPRPRHPVKVGSAPRGGGERSSSLSPTARWTCDSRLPPPSCKPGRSHRRASSLSHSWCPWVSYPFQRE